MTVRVPKECHYRHRLLTIVYIHPDTNSTLNKNALQNDFLGVYVSDIPPSLEKKLHMASVCYTLIFDDKYIYFNRDR